MQNHFDYNFSNDSADSICKNAERYTYFPTNKYLY